MFTPTHITAKECHCSFEVSTYTVGNATSTLGSFELLPAGSKVEVLGTQYGPGSDVWPEVGVRLADGRERRIGMGVPLLPIEPKDHP